MLLNKHLAGAVIAAAVLVIGVGAEAKGPQGVGASAGASPSNSASSSSQGNSSNTWSQPPGWSKADDSKGWNGGRHRPVGTTTLLAKSTAGAPMRRPIQALPSTKAGECLFCSRLAPPGGFSFGAMKAASSEVGTSFNLAVRYASTQPISPNPNSWLSSALPQRPGHQY